MAIERLDNKGLKYPECILKMAKKSAHMKPGDILEVRADCESFEKDVRAWCEDTGRVLLSVEDEGEDTKIVGIQF